MDAGTIQKQNIKTPSSMNALEKIALSELRSELISANDKLHQNNVGRIEHERIFIKGNIERAMNIIKALEENSKTQQP